MSFTTVLVSIISQSHNNNNISPTRLSRRRSRSPASATDPRTDPSEHIQRTRTGDAGTDAADDGVEGDGDVRGSGDTDVRGGPVGEAMEILGSLSRWGGKCVRRVELRICRADEGSFER